MATNGNYRYDNNTHENGNYGYEHDYENGNGNGALPDYDRKGEKLDGNYGDGERRHSLYESESKFNRLGWKKLTICLIVEAIALGSLSVPSAFASLGMVPGVIVSVFLGLIAIYTSYVVGQVKLKYPWVDHYADAVGLIWGRFGYELTGVLFVLLLVILVGSHVLTGTIAWIRIVDHLDICALAWGVLSAVLLFALMTPPTFSEFAILGYIDFVSIIVAIGITIIATGVEASKQPGGLNAVPWTLWPPKDITFYEVFLSTTNIIFAYSFAVCQFSFMAEMHTPKDYVKAIWALGLSEIVIYTGTGALIYAFVGPNVNSPAILSAPKTVSRIAFGIALPVIFISGSINGTVAGRYILGRAFKNSSIKYINDKKGWIAWLVLLVIITIIAFVIAEAVPFFNDLLGLISALFISGFTFYFPALFWFGLIKEGKWYRGWRNITLSILNALVFAIGIIVLGCGTYAAIEDILQQYATGKVHGSFTCQSSAYISES